MNNKLIRHIVMRKYQKHDDAIRMSKEIIKSLSNIQSVHQFDVRLNHDNIGNCDIVVCTEFQNDEIYDIYNKDPSHAKLGEKIATIGYNPTFHCVDYYIDQYTNYNHKQLSYMVIYTAEKPEQINELQNKLNQIQNIEQVNKCTINQAEYNDVLTSNAHLVMELQFSDVLDVRQFKQHEIYQDITKFINDNQVVESTILYK